MRNSGHDDAAKSSGLRWCSSQVAAMLMEDDSQRDLDHEAVAIVEEEEGSSNVGCGSMVMLQVHRGCGGVISKWLLCCWRMATEGSKSRGNSDGGGRRGQQQRRLRLRCDFVATGGDGSCLQAAMVEVVVAMVRLQQREEGQQSAHLLLRRVATVERSLSIALCSERSLLVMIKSLLVAIKVDGRERSLLATIKEDDSERSLLVVLCSERSLLVVIKVVIGLQ
ncbi:hypothetical protein B296_00006416 [Ensete ventricosum]|uniref:Uncharacterized protein n=1 Tax=Ensete ventricosum TaxID=4639 RepID=A0A427BBP2_ENSVE|nr:hypothetical protein B296_00006416 [Ensete ventricosum]